MKTSPIANLNKGGFKMTVKEERTERAVKAGYKAFENSFN